MCIYTYIHTYIGAAEHISIHGHAVPVISGCRWGRRIGKSQNTIKTLPSQKKKVFGGNFVRVRWYFLLKIAAAHPQTLKPQTLNPQTLPKPCAFQTLPKTWTYVDLHPKPHLNPKLNPKP